MESPPGRGLRAHTSRMGVLDAAVVTVKARSLSVATAILMLLIWIDIGSTNHDDTI